MDSNQLLSPLSRNLRKWRLRRQLSASALARKANVSKSTISELERGQGNPSFDTLWAIANALDVSLSAFFTAPSAESQPMVVRLADASTVASEGDVYRTKLLAAWPGAGDVELFMVEFKTSAQRNSEGNATGVVERAICIEGIVEIGIQDELYVLGLGDMLTFDAGQDHFSRSRTDVSRLLVLHHYPRAVEH